ncbi:response regulator [Tundrisphaera lichenicola]|uniref:response regulator n=1 Tax=Tundrisphaera lichenicola TaxID=2029860 RepID=UPI003EB7AFF2
MTDVPAVRDAGSMGIGFAFQIAPSFQADPQIARGLGLDLGRHLAGLVHFFERRHILLMSGNLNQKLRPACELPKKTGGSRVDFDAFGSPDRSMAENWRDRGSSTMFEQNPRSIEECGSMPNKANGNPRMMLVEDAPFLRYAFARLLRMQGYDVVEVNHGQEALDRLEETRPDLILTDLMMPVMGGLEMISQIRANHEHDDIQIVVVTADYSQQGRELALRAGASDVIAKPIDIPGLLERLRALALLTTQR